jgi:hypothetical protein
VRHKVAFWEKDVMRNTVYAIIIVVCLIAAGAVVFTTRSSGNSLGVPASVQIWVKCMHCGDTHQMSLKNFWKQQAARMPTVPHGMPPSRLICPKCGQDALMEAFKCPKCGEISPKGGLAGVSRDDRCPKCGYSPRDSNTPPAD